MAFSISLPDSLRDFLEDEMREHRLECFDEFVGFLLERAQKRKPPRRTFKVDGQTYRLTRLSDHQNNVLWESSIAIKVDSDLACVLARSDQRLNLAETYAVCRHLFGERGTGFDDWKGDFAFPFALEVPRAARRPAYMFRVVNYRSGVEYSLSKQVDPNDERLKNPVYYPPDDDEFSREDIIRFVSFFVGFLQGFFESLATRWEDRFLLTVPSNLILFGFDGENFFTRQFDSPEKFEKRRATLAKRLPTPGFCADDWDYWDW